MKRNVFALALTTVLLIAVSLPRSPRTYAQEVVTRLTTPTVAGARYVSTAGADTGECLESASPCRTIQYAINLSTRGDEIRVAEGVYTETDGTVVILKKGVTLSGGWRADFAQRDPAAYPTILDAQGRGSVIRILGAIAPTMDGLTIIGGDASLNADDPGKGGGIYSKDASPIITNNIISGNLAHSSTEMDGYGGGIYLENASSSALISANQVFSNTASTGYIGWGGGIYLSNSDAVVDGNSVFDNVALVIAQRKGVAAIPFAAHLLATPPPVESEQSGGGGIGVKGGALTISNNHIFDNISSLSDSGGGGGIYASESAITITNNLVEGNLSSAADNGVGGGIAVYSSTGPVVTSNTVRNNTASLALVGKGGGIALKWIWDAAVSNNVVYDNVSTTAWYGHGGGIFVKFSFDSEVSNNQVYSNTASLIEEGQGGGIFTRYGDIHLLANHVYSNTASLTGMGEGGGIFSAEGVVTMTQNLVEDNTGSNSNDALGGGIYLWDETATLNSNIILGNIASLEGAGYGGGVYFDDCYPSTLINNIIVQNQASIEGGGVEILGKKLHTQVSLVNNTLADNDVGAGEGVFLSGDAQASLINNIITGHTFGIFASTAGIADASYTLFFDNDVDIGGPGSITNLNPVYGDPKFADRPNGDYRLQADSAALDAGDPLGVPPAPANDFEGDPRPLGDAVDIGADEAPAIVPAMHVENISLYYRAANGRLTAKITIFDADGLAVPDANVLVKWRLPNGATRRQQKPTDATGLAIFRIQAPLSGAYIITVLNVEKEGWLYDSAANKETTDSIVVP